MQGSAFLEDLGNHLTALSFELPLDPFYKNLIHNDNDLNSFYDACVSLCDQNDHFKNIRLCSKLLKFLKNSNTRTNNIKSAYDDCILFNYWMYGELEQRYTKRKNYKSVHAFAELQSIWNSLIEEPKNTYYYDKCNPDSNIVNQNDWKQRKDLYDYCVNYELIQKEIQFYKQNCRQLYAYIKGKSHLYEHFKTRCPSEDKNKCPKFYSKCKDYHPDTVLPLLDCHKDIIEEESSLAIKAPSKESLQDFPPGGKLTSDGLQLKNDSSPPATQAGNVFLGVVVTSMTSGALYKFTPLGNMLRNRFGWNNNNMRNFNGGDIRLYDYSAEPFNPYPGEEHYIGYHPA